MRNLPFIESSNTLFLKDLPDHIPSVQVLRIRVIRLQPCSDDLIWICNAPGKHLACSTEEEEIQVGKVVLPSSCDGPMVLQLLIGHELDRTMTDSEERGYETTIEPFHPLGCPDL